MDHGSIPRNTAKGLIELRKRIETSKIPERVIDDTINLATWNVREFGKRRRKAISVHLIAEIMNRFDLIAVTEVRDKLTDLERVLDILGPYWRVVFSDFNTDRRGNRERIAFVYDKRTVAFTGLAAEPDPPRRKDPETGESVSAITWWRSPYMASFKSGSFDFILLAAHIRWDSTGGKKSRQRELQMMADWVGKRRKEKGLVDKDLIILGDFNISDDKLFKTVTSGGLKVPRALKRAFDAGVGTNLMQNKRYDQILHYPAHTKCFADRGGILDFYTGGFRKILPGLSLTKRESTYQVSDHLPLWIQVKINLESERLDQRLNRDRGGS